MLDHDELVKHILDIKERIITIEVHVKEQKEDLKEHSQKSLEMQQRVEALKSEMDEVRGSLKLLKWMAPTFPAVFLLAVKLLEII